MSKKEVVRTISDMTGLAQNDVAKVLDSLALVASRDLVAGERFTMPGIGNFSIKVRAERTGRNPQTGEAILVPEKRVVAFKALKAFPVSL